MDKGRIREIIFETDTTAGKVFDIALLVSIGISVLAVLLESVDSIAEQHGTWLRVLEWGFTLLFTVEYFIRLYSTEKPKKYATSFFGVVDLLSIIPTYLSLFFTGSQSLLVIRGLRLLRIFRVLKFVRHVSEARVLMQALRGSRPKITVFLGAVFTITIICGTAMYMVEGEQNGFNNIPDSIYWAIVTTTTVGYGDLVPQTVLGKCIASVMMIMGYSILAVPTGIVSVELARASRLSINLKVCKACSAEGHDVDAVYCRFCGAHL